jgi:hypothetical protein
LPQAWNIEHFKNNERINRAVAISANKLSFVSEELYSLRTGAYSNSDSLDFFGLSWDPSVINYILEIAREVQIALLGRLANIMLACLCSPRLKPMKLIV